MQGILILPIHFLLVLQLLQDGQQVGRIGWVAIEDVSHEWFHLDRYALSCLSAHIGDGAAFQVGLAEKCHVDEGDAAGTETEEEEVAEKHEPFDVLSGFLACSFLSVVCQLCFDIQMVEAGDSIGRQGAFVGFCHTPIGADEGVVSGKPVSHRLVPYGTQGAKIAGGGVAADALRPQPSFKVGYQSLSHLCEGDVLLADAVQVVCESSAGAGVVSRRAETSQFFHVADLGCGIGEILASCRWMQIIRLFFHIAVECSVNRQNQNTRYAPYYI